MHLVRTATFGAMCGEDSHCTNNSTSASYICPTSPVAFTWSTDQTDTQIYVTAYPIRMIHQPTDMSLLQSSTSHLHTSPGQTTAMHQTTSKPTAPASHGVSAKVIAPAVAVPVIVLIAIIGGIIYMLRRRKQRQRTRAYAGEPPRTAFVQEKNDVRSSIISSELPSYRMDRSSDRVELPSP